MEKHQKQDLFMTLTQIIMQQRLENLVELLKFCEKYQDELNLPNLEVIIGVIGINYPSLKTEVCSSRPYGQW